MACDFDKVEPAERNSVLYRFIYIFDRCYCCRFNMSGRNSDNNSNNMILLVHCAHLNPTTDGLKAAFTFETLANARLSNDRLAFKP